VKLPKDRRSASKERENSAQVHLERGKFQKTNNRLLVRAFTVQPSTLSWCIDPRGGDIANKLTSTLLLLQFL
jgi:hypothetical protein